MKKLLILLSIIALASCAGNKKTEAEEAPKFTEDWESLFKHEVAPEWFRDAKLGIYFHWGPYSVPACGSEWYPRQMHIDGTWENKNHLEKYGHPSEFAYHDFIPMFKAEYFDAAEWADLFQKAGARFAGPVAEHHDGFAMWDSEATPWNAADMGPEKDITGLLAAELKKRDIPLITTFHHSKQLQRYDSAENYAYSHYPWDPEMPTSSDDPKLQMLYGNMDPDVWHRDIWYGKLKEVIDNYQPDIIWFDYALDRIPEEWRQKFAAYYLNEAEKWDKDVVIVTKGKDLPLELSVDDYEKSRMNRMGEIPWMTDETVSKGSWCYTENLQIKSAPDVLHVLIDINSKNGVLLLNVSPMANGIIPDNQQEVLLSMGAWLDSYGETIYESRPWYTFGEGPTKEPEGKFENHKDFLKVKYSWKDVRYSTQGSTIYASLLGYPDVEEINLTAFAADSLPEPVKIKAVTMLGSEEKIEWSLEEGGLKLSVPAEAPDDMAVVYKIETK